MNRKKLIMIILCGIGLVSFITWTASLLIADCCTEEELNCCCGTQKGKTLVSFGCACQNGSLITSFCEWEPIQ